MISSFLVSALLAALPAAAQQPGDWTFTPGAVLSPNAGIPFMSQTISSPAVVFDSNNNRFLMVFETRTTTVDARCPQGVWALGAASSPDGVTWTPFVTPILTPNPNSTRFFNCVAAHPTTLYSPTAFGGNGGVLVVFKGEQTNDACAVGNPSWGCDPFSGFGRLTIQLDAAGDPLSVTTRLTPIVVPVGTNAFGFPKLVQDFPDFRLLYQEFPDIVGTTALTLASLPPATPELVVSDFAGSVPWVTDELFNPTLLCDDDPAFPYATFVGGRDNGAGGAVLSGGWGKAINDVWGVNDFLLEVTPQQTWANNTEWRHWDILRTTTGEYLVWYDEKDINGNNFIRFGTTDPAFTPSTVMSKVCP